MTKQKIEKIRQEMIALYGDRELVRIYDRSTNELHSVVRISNVPLHCTADITEAKRIIKEGRPRAAHFNFAKKEGGEQ